MELHRIGFISPSCAPSIRVYRDYISINAAAAKLIGLKAGGCVDFYEESPSSSNPHGRLYIGANSSGIKTKPHDHTHRIFSRKLCKNLATHLEESTGAYKLEPNDSVTYMGIKYYSIFFKRHE